MINVLRNYNANAVKQVIRTAEEMAARNGSLQVKDIIREMISLSDNLETAIRNQLVNGLEKENEKYLNQ